MLKRRITVFLAGQRESVQYIKCAVLDSDGRKLLNPVIQWGIIISH
jgi:hypothetical protein